MQKSESLALMVAASFFFFSKKEKDIAYSWNDVGKWTKVGAPNKKTALFDVKTVFRNLNLFILDLIMS